MSHDPHDPEAPPRRPDDEEEAPHGLVSEIREEIEHAVENVPKPVRWTVRKLVVLAILAVLGLTVVLVGTGLLYLANRTEWVAKELTVFVNGTLARRTDLTVDIADIQGNPLREVRLIRPRVRFRDGSGPALLEAPSIQLKYSVWGMLSTRSQYVDVLVDSAVIRLGGGEDGQVRVPQWRSTGAASKKPGGFDVRLRLRGATFESPGRRIEGLGIDALVSTAAPTQVLLRKLSWEQGPFATRRLELSGELSAGDSLRFVVQRLRTADLELTASGGWKRGDAERALHVDVSRVRWRWLAEATGSQSFDVDGEGAAVIDARGAGDWQGHLTFHGQWSDLPAEGSGDFAWKNGGIVVDPLVGRTAAGDLVGRAAWSRAGWEVGGRASAGDPARWDFLGLHDWPSGRLNGEFHYAVDSRRRQSSARLSARLGASEIAGWRSDSARVEVRFPATGPDSFTVAMLRLGGEVHLVGQSTESGWQGDWVAARFPLQEWPDGRASGIHGILSHGEGTVAGHDGALDVTGALDGMATDWLGARFDRWRLREVRGRLLPKPDLAARGRFEDFLFLGVHFDSVQGGFQLGDQTVSLQEVTASAGDTLVSLDGRSDWSPDGWHVSLERARAQSGQFDWLADPPVTLAGDREGVTFERFDARDGDARLELSGRWASPEGAFDWTARGGGLDLSRLGLPAEWGLSGRADAALEVRGPAERPRWAFEADCSSPGWQGHRGDSLTIELAGSPSTLEVHRAEFRLDGGTAAVQGAVEDMAEAWPDTLTAEGVVRWLRGGARWNGGVTLDRLPLDRLERLAAAARGWSGRVSGRLAVSGSPARPVLEATVEAQPLSWRGYLVDRFTTRFDYADGRLRVPELTMTRADLVSRISGELPLRLALGSVPEVPEEPMSGRFAVPNGDLAVLPLFVPQVGSASGKFELSAEMGGTPHRPELNGTLRVREGQVRMAGREEVVRDVSADCRLDESRITLDSLTARQGDRGRVSAHGVVQISGAGLESYRFDVRMRDFTAVEAGVYAAEFDGDFTVTNGPRVGGQILPMVVGRAELKRSVILFDFANQSEVQRIAATTKPLFWTYRIQAYATNNLHWRPPDGDIEFSANLSLEQTPDQLIMYGDMSALRGTYYFLSNRFNVQQADLTFDNLNGVDPQLQVVATTQVVPLNDAGYQLGSATSRNETHTVTVTISGRSSEPVIEFQSDPKDWDEAQILRELTLGRFYAGGVSLGDPLDNYLTRAINKTLSAEMSRAFRGYISEWQIDRERGGLLSGQGDVIVGLGTQITPNLLLRYRQRVPGLAHETVQTTDNPFERDFEAEYRLNRFFYLTSELTQRRALGGTDNTVSGGPEFNVNLKARWEY